MSKHFFRLRSCVSSICELENMVNRITDLYGVNHEKFPDILISLTEAVNNAIIHGNKSNLEKYVHIHISKSSQNLIFTVSDEGNGFNPQAIPDPTTPENIHCCGGRGVYLIKELADDVSFENNGSTVQICFRI